MKKIMSKFYLLLLISLSVLMISCSDDSPTEPPADTKPYIDSLRPDIAYVGFQITIYGRNFGAARGSSIIKVGSIVVEEKNINSWEDTKIQFVLPDNVPADTLGVTVRVEGVESNSKDLIILEKQGNAPQITALSKLTATIGETIAILGKNFGNPQTTSWVEFNGVKADPAKWLWTDTRIVAVIPEGATSGDVVVWVNNVPSNGVHLTIQGKFKLLEMVEIKAGTFTMGDDNNSEMDNKPAHKVTITKDFLMSKTEITQKQWKVVMDNSNPSHPNDTGDAKPVQQVTFVRAVEFCNRLSEMEGYTPVYTIDGDNITWNPNANGYRLPTEAEWEYACRAGRKEDYSYDDVLAMAWFADNAAGHTHPVGERQPNAYGLYDMLGNVAEWCWDYYDADYYSKSPENDPRGPETSDFNHRVTRGGSFVNGKTKVNSTIRNSFPGSNENYNYDLGFRVVRNK
jgi:formylglycine-generating enzyme required for sulfatase activity